MSSADREAILSRVRSALAPLKERAPLPDWETELIAMRQARQAAGGAGKGDLWAWFAERMKLLNGTPLVGVEALVAYLQANKITRGYCDPELWPLLKPAFPAGIMVELSFDRTRVDDFAFGITRAAGAIAETGTVILKDASTSNRLGALAPWVHVAVLRRADILPDLQTAVTSLGQDPNIIFVSGPSKTADVEGILIEGVHGPGIQIALLID